MGTISKEVVGAGKAFTSVFRSPSLRRISLAFAASVIGDWAYAVAVSVWAFGQGGATAVGLFGVARYVSMAVLGPLLSTLADRFPRRRVMIGADLVRMVLVVLGAVAIATDGPAVIVYSIGLLTAVASLVFRPAQAALLPQLTRTPSELTSTNVAMSTIESVGFFAGPAIGGVLLAVADVEVVYLVNAVSFLVSALLIAGMGVPSSDAAAPIGDDDVDRGDEPVDAEVVDGRTERFVSEALAGFRTIARNRDLRLIAVLMTAQTVVAGASLVFEVSIAFDLLDLGESGVGVLSAMLGIGGIVGGFVALVLARRERLAGDFGVGVLLWSAPLLLIVVWPTLGATIAAMMVIGVANSIVDINAYTIVQRVAPAEVMGRVFGALESAFTAGMALGALAMPLLIETVGLRTGLAVIGTVVAVMALAGQPALRRIDTTVLAPPGLALRRATCRCWASCRRPCSNGSPTNWSRSPFLPGRWCSARATPGIGSGSSSEAPRSSASAASTAANSARAIRSARSPCCAMSRVLRPCVPATRRWCSPVWIATTSSRRSPEAVSRVRWPMRWSIVGWPWADAAAGLPIGRWFANQPRPRASHWSHAVRS